MDIPSRRLVSRQLTVVWLAAVFFGARPAHSQTLVGRVLDSVTGAPISTIAVMLIDTAETAVAWAESDSVGRVVLQAPAPGVYRVYADGLGLEALLSDTFPLRDEAPAELEIWMNPMPIELEELVVSTERRRQQLDRVGFYQRRRASMGSFFEAEEIAAIDPYRITDLFRTLPAVRVMRDRFGGAVATTWRRGRPCPMKIVLDGFKLEVGDIPLDSWVDPRSVIGVEVYPGGVGAPVQYRGTDAWCGVIMIWTR